MSAAQQLAAAMSEAGPLKAADYAGKLSDAQRKKLISAIMAKTHRDFRSSKGDSTHPSVLNLGKSGGTELVPLMTASDDTLREIATKKKVLVEDRFVIGARGLEKPSGDKLTLIADRIYWLGASSSPKMIFVTKVTDDTVSYKSYPFDGSELRIETWIARDLISRGTTTYLKNYGKHMDVELKRSAEDLLSGGQGKPQKLKDWEKVYVLVKRGPGHEKDDLWRDAEEYGSVGGLTLDGVEHYEILTNNKTLDSLKKDKKFKIVKTGDKPLG